MQPSDRDIFADFFQKPVKPELFKKLSLENQEYCRYLQELGKKITILTQEEQEGYGHAVYCAKEWVQDETFLLMLGDHIYSSDIERSCARQVLDVYEQVNQNVVGLIEMPETIIHKAGCVTGVWHSVNEILTLTQVYEKPSVEYARQNLRVGGIAKDRFLCIFGLYVLTSKIFDFLEEHIQSNFRERGEFQLTSCLEQLRQDEGITGYIMKGKTFDIGMPEAYWQTIIDFRG